MKPEEAVKYARKKARTTALVVLGSFGAITFFEETQGDLANGILFFFAAFFNIVILGMLVLLLALSHIFGGLAGKEIMIQRKNFVGASVKYAVITGLISTIYLAFAGSAFVISRTNSKEDSIANLLPSIIGNGVVLTVLLLIAWCWAGSKMKAFRDKSNGVDAVSTT